MTSKLYRQQCKYQLQKYERYCEQKQLNPAFPITSERLTDYLAHSFTDSKTRNIAISLLAKFALESKTWARDMRKIPAVRQLIQKNDEEPLPPVFATVCQWRPMKNQQWTVQRIS